MVRDLLNKIQYNINFSWDCSLEGLKQFFVFSLAETFLIGVWSTIVK